MTSIDLPPGGILGIDPGSASGAIAYVLGELAVAWPLKDMTDRETWERIVDCARYARFAVLERVNAMPRQGVASSFKFGASFGSLRMALVAAGIRFVLVPPSKWQGELNCRTGGDKRITRDHAQRRFPEMRITNVTADAILLACWGERELRRELVERSLEQGAVA